MTTHKSRMPLVSVVLLLAFGAGMARSQSAPQLSPVDLVKNVIYNETHTPGANNIHWKYRLEKMSAGRQETRTVVETQSGSIDKLLAIAGKPLTAVQEAAEAKRILKFSHSQEEQQKAEQSRRKDADQCNAMLKMIPDAFIFEQTGQNGNAVRLTFNPNPRFQPPSREGKVLQQMAGEMWVDTNQQRLISINGRLMNEVKFGGGFLGHLEKGGQFTVRRAEVAPGDWEVTELNVNMQGRALLFKSICVQQKEAHSNFERMPDDITVVNAANLLLRQSLVASVR